MSLFLAADVAMLELKFAIYYKAYTALCCATLFMTHCEQTAFLVFELSAMEMDASVC